MTRADAIDWIRRLIATMKEETSGDFPEPKYKDEVYEALDMAIKELEQEPCKDAISREKTMQIIREWFDRDAKPSELEDAIEQMSSVQPEPKTGHWINTDKYYLGWKCSECGCHTIDTTPHFCPNCGAKMESEVEE